MRQRKRCKIRVRRGRLGRGCASIPPVLRHLVELHIRSSPPPCRSLLSFFLDFVLGRVGEPSKLLVSVGLHSWRESDRRRLFDWTRQEILSCAGGGV